MTTGMRENSIAVIDGQDIERVVRSGQLVEVAFAAWDGNVLSGLTRGNKVASQVAGVIHPRRPGTQDRFAAPGDAQVLVEVAHDRSVPKKGAHPGTTVTVDGTEFNVRAWAKRGQRWDEADVRVVPVRTELFSRARGILETNVLAGKTVLLKGLGSVGSSVGRLLAQSGVCRFILMDHDRLDVCNVIRHEAGLSHIGRLKTKFMADLIHEKNPYAEVRTIDQKATAENMDLIRELVEDATLCIDTADEREGKLLLNRACLETETPLVISGAFRRAYGGQVLRVRPGQSACYGCFVKMLANDGPAYQDADTEAIAYSDRPVPIEPGLSIDIEPISHMTAKVALQELLGDVPTSLRSLDEDLEANWFLWISRREEGTQYADWEPLGFGMDGMRVLRWYGVDFKRDPECPICAGLTVDETERGAFMEAYAPKGAKHE